MKRCLVIGARGSIGRVLTQHLEAQGWQVVGTTSQAAEADGQSLLHLDLTSHHPAHYATLATQLAAPLDGVVVTAGYEPSQNLRQLTPEHLGKMMAIHLTGPIYALQALVKADKLAVGCSLVLISSVAAHKGSYDPGYATVKGGVVSLTRTLARELAPNVRVNALAPSLVDGSTVHQVMTDDFRQRHLNTTLTQRLVTDADCAQSIFFLLTQPGLTGTILHLNAGQHFA